MASQKEMSVGDTVSISTVKVTFQLDFPACTQEITSNQFLKASTGSPFIGGGAQCGPYPPYPNISHFLPHSPLSKQHSNPIQIRLFLFSFLFFFFVAKADYLTDFDDLDESTTDLSRDFRARCLPEGHLSLWVAPTSILSRRNTHTHPPFPVWKRYRSVRCLTTRLRSSFFCWGCETPHFFGECSTNVAHT